MRKPWLQAVLLAVTLVALVVAGALAGRKGKMYVKGSEALLTERSGQVCRAEGNNYCERNYECPAGKVAHAMVYNIKDTADGKQLAGIALVCSDPNAFSDPVYVGPAGDKFAGEVINDYCPVGYMLVGAEFATDDRIDLTGVRRICRRYDPADLRQGPNLFGQGFDTMRNVCPDDHWVTGLKVSFERTKDDADQVKTSLINARFYCNEIRHFLIEPSDEEYEEQIDRD